MSDIGDIVALHPRMKNTLSMLLPRTLPRAMPTLPLRAAFTDTASSGNELPAETMVIPMSASESPKPRAISDAPLSLLVSEMNLLLLKELEEFKSDGFGLPIGNLTSVAYLSGKVFKIPLTAEPLGTVAGEVRTDLIDAGINQTLHRVTLCFAVTVRYYSPLHEVADTLYFEVLIAETLVVGEVPIYKE